MLQGPLQPGRTLDTLRRRIEKEPVPLDLDPIPEEVEAGRLVNCDLFLKEGGIYYVYPETIYSIEEWHHADILRNHSGGRVVFREKGHPNAGLAIEHKQKVLLFNSLLDIGMTREEAIVKAMTIDLNGIKKKE